MIDRYTNIEIKKIWSNNHKYEVWYELEKINARAVAKNKNATLSDWAVIDWDSNTIKKQLKQNEVKYRHDVIAFVKLICDYNKKNAWAIHYGLTSSDLVDSFNSVAHHESIEVMLNALEHLVHQLAHLGFKHTYTEIIARTHGQNAALMRLGHKLTIYMKMLLHCDKTFTYSGLSGLALKMSGPVGETDNNPNTDDSPMLRMYPITVPDYECSQIIPRVYYYNEMASVLQLSLVLNNIANDLRLLNQTEISEWKTTKSATKVYGSSSMPHKVNPIGLEKICGMTRLIKGYFTAFIDNLVLWNERDISNSCVERIVFEDIYHIIMHQLLCLSTEIENGYFDIERIEKNVKAAVNIDSHSKLKAYQDKGMSWVDAWKKVKSESK